jgi:hypothetical protein
VADDREDGLCLLQDHTGSAHPIAGVRVHLLPAPLLPSCDGDGDSGLLCVREGTELVCEWARSSVDNSGRCAALSGRRRQNIITRKQQALSLSLGKQVPDAAARAHGLPARAKN